VKNREFFILNHHQGIICHSTGRSASNTLLVTRNPQQPADFSLDT
jgi:hypothetical protein